MPPRQTSGVDAALAVFDALNAEERDEVERLVRERQDRARAGDLTAGEALLTAMRSVAAATDGPLTPDAYRKARAAWKSTSEEVPPLNHLCDHFGSWALAREALALNDAEVPEGKGRNHQTIRRIEARFQSRQLHKVWKYTDAKLGEVLLRCAADLGRAPTVAEFTWWRDREIQIAKARGDHDVHIPSDSPFRKRWQTWENTLVHFDVPGRELRHEQQTAP